MNSNPNRLTPTERDILRHVAAETALRGGAVCSKRDLAEVVGRNVKTVDHAVASLRSRGLVEVEARFDERGGQLASRYRATFSPPEGSAAEPSQCSPR
ncbi:hypothetical protein [Thermophilibacter sp.]